jgi:glycosyltransferase involved in cell wall biosynthesis
MAKYKGARMRLVSVIIPAFNAAASIGATIDSVLSQTLQDIEIIVSDDGSTDSTAAVVSRYRNDPRVRYMFHENRGTSHAKNMAARQAKGEYLAFLDSDDAFDRTALETMVHQFRATGAVWCAVDIVKRIGDDKIIGSSQPPSGDLLLGILEEDFIRVSPFYLRTAFVASGMFDEDLSVREDWDINIRMVEEGRPFTYINKPLYIYTRTEGSLMTGNLMRVLTCTERVLRKHHKKLADAGNTQIAAIYARNMWRLARRYFYEARDFREAFRCVRESLRYNLSLHRLFHPIIHRIEVILRKT